MKISVFGASWRLMNIWSPRATQVSVQHTLFPTLTDSGYSVVSSRDERLVDLFPTTLSFKVVGWEFHPGVQLSSSPDEKFLNFTTLSTFLPMPVEQATADRAASTGCTALSAQWHWCAGVNAFACPEQLSPDAKQFATEHQIYPMYSRGYLMQSCTILHQHTRSALFSTSLDISWEGKEEKKAYCLETK